MQATKQALRSKIVGDSGFVAQLGGAHVYYQSSAIDMTALLSSGAKAIVTLYEVVGGRTDRETPQASELFQFDIWSKNNAANDALADSLIQILDPDDPVPSGWTSITITGRRLGDIRYEPPTSEGYESDIEVHHKIVQFRITSYPA